MENLFKEYVDMFKRWSDFEGKSNVREYWMPVLISFIIGTIIGMLKINVLSYIYSLIVIIPMISLTIRRLHDTDNSGWNYLWWFLPIIGWIIIILKLVKPSQ